MMLVRFIHQPFHHWTVQWLFLWVFLMIIFNPVYRSCAVIFNNIGHSSFGGWITSNIFKWCWISSIYIAIDKICCRAIKHIISWWRITVMKLCCLPLSMVIHQSQWSSCKTMANKYQCLITVGESNDVSLLQLESLNKLFMENVNQLINGLARTALIATDCGDSKQPALGRWACAISVVTAGSSMTSVFNQLQGLQWTWLYYYVLNTCLP